MKKNDYFKNTIKPSLFPDKHSFLLPLICKNKPNFKNQESNTTNCNSETYNDIFSKNHKKNKPKTNPNKPNFRERKKRGARATRWENKPNTNPIQTQSKAKPNPIKPNYSPEKTYPERTSQISTKNRLLSPKNACPAIYRKNTDRNTIFDLKKKSHRVN